MGKCNLLVFLVFSGISSVLAQNSPGTWHDYFSYANAIKISDTGEKIFCASDGGLFYLDLSDNSMNKISEEDGLSDVGMQTIAWNESRKLLLIAYQNSNIDLILENKIINLSDIKRKLLSGDKTVYNVIFQGNEAFLACGFGVVDLDLTKNEIKGTYIIGDNGTQVKVFDLETDGQTLYAATETGILTADLNNANLLDYRNWTRITGIPHAYGKFSQLARFNGNLIAVYTQDAWSGDEAYIYRNGQWQRIMSEVGYFVDIQANTKYLTVTGREEVFTYDVSLNSISRIKSFSLGNLSISTIQPKSAICSSDGSLWIADYMYGLIQNSGQNFEQYLPSGPMNNSVFSLTTHKKELWSASGGRTDPWNNQYRAPVFQHLKRVNGVFSQRKNFLNLQVFTTLFRLWLTLRMTVIFLLPVGGVGFLSSKTISLSNDITISTVHWKQLFPKARRNHIPGLAVWLMMQTIPFGLPIRSHPKDCTA